jgi:hypothetical protein
MSQNTDKTIYILDPDTNTLIPYKPDYNAGVPFTTPESLDLAQSKQKAPRAPKTDKQLGVIVPLIKQRPNQSDYVQLATIARKYPRVNTIAVISPTNDERGIGDIGGPDPEYQNAIRFLQANGVQVVGYINADTTNNKTRDDVEREVDRWQQWYPDINGLFFDRDVVGTAYAKVDKGFSLIIADLASDASGGVLNTPILNANPGPIDIYVIYNREGYPAEGWYPSIRKDWMSQHPRSRFAFIPYRVTEDTLACRNFIDKVVGIEKLAGYVYVQSSYETDRRKMREWTNISPLLEVTLDQLDRMAQQEGIPSTKGVVPETMKIDTGDDGFFSRFLSVVGTTTATSESSEENVGTNPIAPEDVDFDKFGVRKIYPSAEGKQAKEWTIFMDNPRADSKFKISSKTLEKQADGSWQPKDKEVVLEVDTNKCLNVEMTGYFKIVQLSPKTMKWINLVEMFVGREDNSPERYSRYCGKLLKDGAVSVLKFIATKGVTGNRGTTQATNTDLINRWIGMKFMVYNYPYFDQKTKSEQTGVQMEIYVDDNVTDENGNLVLKNDWRRIMSMSDTGGWFAKSPIVKKKGKKNQKKTKGKELDDRILTSPGNGVAWSWFNSVINFKFLSVREIRVPTRD